MGSFDTVHTEIAYHCKGGHDVHQFQTKDLGCGFAVFELSRKGVLTLTRGCMTVPIPKKIEIHGRCKTCYSADYNSEWWIEAEVEIASVVTGSVLTGENTSRTCFKCGSNNLDFGCLSVVSVDLADSSFSGTFQVWLCWDCASMLHVGPYKRIL